MIPGDSKLLQNEIIRCHFRINQETLGPTQSPTIHRWNSEFGYNETKNDCSQDYPRRVFSAGFQAGINVENTIPYKDFDNLCRSIEGFKVSLHSPTDVPRLSKNFFHISLDKLALVSVKPQMITTSPELRNYDPNQRKCYFDGERPLQFFKLYSQNNCELECLSNHTKEACGCVKFSYPSNEFILYV